MALRSDARAVLRRGTVFPAHPLALTADRELDAARQARLTRYYLDAGMGGVAVGVHTTQFDIRKVGLYEPVLRIAIETVQQHPTRSDAITIAGVVGDTPQAVKEAETAAALGYDLVLVGLGGLRSKSNAELVAHVRRIAEISPVFGFYLQPSVGGMHLGYDFWRELAEIENVEAIKIAPFNRYRTLDVVRAVAESSRADEIALYTGNDDNIIADLLTPFRFPVGNRIVEKRIAGGLLGHWAVWAKTVVEQLEAVHQAIATNDACAMQELLATGVQITDANAALFDSTNDFAGCIPGIHEVLRRQGLLEGLWTLDPDEVLSPGQMEEIDRVYAAYPHLNDDAFVQDFLKRDSPR
jgi:hypothetical protein